VANFLLIAPADPGLPAILASVAQALKNRCPSQHSVTLLSGAAADRTRVDQELLNHTLVIYFGHGQRDSLGSPGLPLVDIGNEQDVQKILIAIACKAAAGLGNNYFAQSNTGAFIGFDTYLIHPTKAFARANDAYEVTLASLMSGSIMDDVGRDMRNELQQAARDYLVNRASYRLVRGEALNFFAGLRSSALALQCIGNTQLSV
jgi:hypothetical protein